jgi:DNA-binding MarR family transcriptional regulator
MDSTSSSTGRHRRPHPHPYPPPRRSWQNIHSPQSHINYWLKLVETRFSTQLGRELKKCNLIASEWAALRELYRPSPLSPLDVARALGMSKGGASKLIDRLVEKALVEKKTSTFDRRHRAVSLTVYGRSLVPSLALFEATTHRQFFRPLRDKGRQRLMAALQRTLGAENTVYLDQWISIGGDGGQWILQPAWHNSIRRGPSHRPTLRSSEQSLRITPASEETP